MSKKYRLLICLLLLCMAAAYFVPFGSLLLKKTEKQQPLASDTARQTVSLSRGAFVLFGSYAQTPILWQILDVENGRPLLLAAHVICFKAFDAGNGKDGGHDAADIQSYGTGDWSNCALAVWLNAREETVTYPGAVPNAASVSHGYNAYAGEPGFLCNENFSAALRGMIADDGVFLPTQAQIKTLLPLSQRRKTPTAAAVSQNDAPYIVSTSLPVWYWTSTPAAANRIEVTAVTSAGNFYKSPAFDGAMGVCPALYLKTAAVLVDGGSGTAEHPYRMAEVPT